MKKWLSRLLSLSLLLSLTACSSPTPGQSGSVSNGGSNGGGAASKEPTGYQETIVWCPRLDFITQDIHHTPSMVTKATYLWVYNQLVEFDPVTEQIIPVLCTSWEQLSDTQWKFHLRDDVYFHNGDKFSAEDVKFSYEIANQGNSAVRVEGIESMEVLDEQTIVINLKSCDMDFLYKITAPEVSILSKKAFDTMPEEEAIKIGTGAYKYGEWVQGDHVEFLANHDYWNGAPKTERIVLRYIPEPSARTIALQTGEVDLIQEPPATDLAAIAEDSNLRLEQYPGSTVSYLFLNCSVAPFDNQLVREAVAHAINFEEIRQAVYLGNCLELNNVMHSSNEFYSDVESYSYDIEKAKELLTEAGYPNGFSSFIATAGQANDVAIATIIQSQLSKAGITLEVQNMDSVAFNALIAPSSTEKIPMGVTAFSGYTYGADSALRVNFHSKGPQNYCNLNDPYVDEMLDKAVAEKDTEVRRQLYAELEQYLVNLAVYLPNCIELNNIGMKDGVEGFIQPNGIIMDLRNVCIPTYD